MTQNQSLPPCTTCPDRQCWKVQSNTDHILGQRARLQAPHVILAEHKRAVQALLVSVATAEPVSPSLLRDELRRIAAVCAQEVRAQVQIPAKMVGELQCVTCSCRRARRTLSIGAMGKSVSLRLKK